LGGGYWRGWELEAIWRAEICVEFIRSERSGYEIPTNDEKMKIMGKSFEIYKCFRVGNICSRLLESRGGSG
jgi:hypothetical protein